MSSDRLRVRLRVMPRLPSFPRGDDDALGLAMWKEVSLRGQRGLVRPSVIAMGEETAYVVDLVPLFGPPALVHRRVSALGGMSGVEALAVVGTMRRRRRGVEAGEPVAVVFAEWPDGRWWFAARPQEDRGGFVAGTEVDVLRAVDGATRPGGLGGWFSRARFEGLEARLDLGGAGGEN